MKQPDAVAIWKAIDALRKASQQSDPNTNDKDK